MQPRTTLLLLPPAVCTVLDAPDETTMARVALVLGSRGTLKTLTLTAIPIDDYIGAVLKSVKD